jgi:anti-sigma factor RsiW
VSVHVTDRLSPYLDGALSADELGRVEAHLETCGACHREYKELRALRQVLRALPEPALPEGFGDRLHWRLGREAAHAAPRRRLGWLRTGPFRVALACATAALLLALPAGRLLNLNRETTLDTDAYLREYLILSVDQPFVAGAGDTLPTSITPTPETPRQ